MAAGAGRRWRGYPKGNHSRVWCLRGEDKNTKQGKVLVHRMVGRCDVKTDQGYLNAFCHLARPRKKQGDYSEGSSRRPVFGCARPRTEECGDQRNKKKDCLKPKTNTNGRPRPGVVGGRKLKKESVRTSRPRMMVRTSPTQDARLTQSNWPLGWLFGWFGEETVEKRHRAVCEEERVDVDQGRSSSSCGLTF